MMPDSLQHNLTDIQGLQNGAAAAECTLMSEIQIGRGLPERFVFPAGMQSGWVEPQPVDTVLFLSVVEVGFFMVF